MKFSQRQAVSRAAYLANIEAVTPTMHGHLVLSVAHNVGSNSLSFLCDWALALKVVCYCAYRYVPYSTVQLYIPV